MKYRSRRELLKIIALGAGSGKASATPVATIDERLSQLFQAITDKVMLRIYRPEDLLELKLTYIGFQYAQDGRTLRKAAYPYLLIVEFPPQSLAEEAFEEDGAADGARFSNQQRADLKGNEQETMTNRDPSYPAKTFLSGSSRLVFSIPSTVNAIPLTAKALLDWDAYTPVVSKRAAAPRTTPVFSRQDIVEDYHNILIKDELPKNIGAGPSVTDLKTTAGNERQGNLDQERRAATKTELIRIQQMESPPAPKVNTSNAGIAAMADDLRFGRTPRPLHAEETCIEMPFRLFISPNEYSAWQHTHALRSKPNAEGSIATTYELWHTRLTCRNCTGGKDASGVLKPMRSVRALWATDISGNHRSKPQRDASFVTSLYNDDRHAIVHESSNWALPNSFVPKPVMVGNLMLTSLGAWMDAELEVKREELERAGLLSSLNLLKWKHIATMARDHHVEIVYAGNMFPFGHEASLVRVTERKPQQGYAVNRQRYFIAISGTERKYDPYDPRNGAFRSFNFSTIRMITTSTPSIDSPQAYCRGIDPQADHQFIPTVGGRDFTFKMVGYDLEGNELDFEMPLVFLSTNVTRSDDGRVNRNNITKLLACYDSDKKRREDISFRNRRMALARSQRAGDTDAAVKSITFSASALADEAPGYHPVCRSLEIYIEAVDNISGGKKATKVELVDDEQNKPASSRRNRSAVYAKIIDGIPIDMGGGKGNLKGGIKPDFTLTGLSKSYGAVGGRIGDVMNGRFDPGSFFSPTAKLFGSISLKDIISAVDRADAASDGAALRTAFPQLKHTKTSEAWISQYTWNAATLKPHDFGMGKFTPKDNRPGNVVVDAKLKRYRDSSKGTVFELDSRIEHFNIELASLAAIRFRKVGFKVDSGMKLDFTVDMDKQPIKFLGVLSFVNDLQKFIPGDGFSDPPFLDVKPDGVLSGFTLGLPDIQVGVFTLRKINLSASVRLPFDGSPMTMRFAFCEKSQPFTLTVAALGGGGFFALEFDMNGLRALEAALEFGAAVSLDLGVASGAVKVMGGIYFKMVLVEGNNRVQLQGYLRINGSMSVMGIISVAVDFLMALNAETRDVNGEEKVDRVWGEATLRVKVEVFMFSKVFRLTVQREFAGAGADPTFGMLMNESDWLAYCDAFAA